tara:strand:+ start:552 stop:1202 length:651 start_codon:yes stop_codon:yes gene_type:complete
MGKEYEFQILDVNVNAMKKKLKEMKGKQIHKNIKLVRSVFNRCNSKIMGFARVRYEGKDTTMTVKIYNNVKFPDEYEVTIKEDFETGKKFLEALNLEMTSYIETYREKWTIPMKGVHEITFDTWPGLPPYMEVDCDNIETMNKLLKLFNVDKEKITYGAAGKKYEIYYGIPQKIVDNKVERMTFDDIKKYFPKPKKNNELFEKISSQQKKKYGKKK